MGKAKSFVKGLVIGAVLGAVAEVVHSTKHKEAKSKALQAVARKIKDDVAHHAKRFGSLTKAAFMEIVDMTVAEYGAAKALSEKEMKDLAVDLKDSWTQVQHVVKGPKPAAKKAPAKKAPAKKKAAPKRKRK
jgi:hypothetical protein